MLDYYSAICDYERSWSEPSMDDEEYEEMLESRADYEEHMANVAGERWTVNIFYLKTHTTLIH